MFNFIIVLPLPTYFKNIYLTYSQLFKAPFVQQCKKKVSLKYILRNHLLEAVFVQRSKILSFATSSSKHHACMCFCPLALWTSGPRHLPPLHPKPIEIKVFRATEGFTQSSLSSFNLYTTTYAALWTTADNKAVPSSIRSATTPYLQIILPISFYRSTLLYTHNHARLTREGIRLSRRVVGRDRTLPLRIENPPQFLLFNQPTPPV